ncbi:MAG: N-6 DNA methylase [Aequorivita sp.]|nr:N-6 DNA methylase [Aequorivita sp.]
MSNKKSTGSYYTPKILSDFLVSHIYRKYLNERENLSILEPSCGDGQFVDSLVNIIDFNDFRHSAIDIVDVNNEELKKASQILNSTQNILIEELNQDYLEYFTSCDKRYSLIIGNPPYIKKNHLDEAQIKRCEEVQRISNEHFPDFINTQKIKNIWPLFVQANIISLEENGVLCLVLPSEILQVKHTRHLRQLISDQFSRVEVFAFNELIFEGIQQDVVAIIGIKNHPNENEHGFSFYQVEELNDLREPKFTEKFSNIHRTTLDKWTNYILSDVELNFVSDLKEKFKPVSHFCTNASVGIVTAANDYFILNEEKLNEFQLKSSRKSLKPILHKGSMLPSVVNFTVSDFELLCKANKAVNLLHIPDVSKKYLGKHLNNYLDKGEELKIHEKYKMTKRNNWYHVPSVWMSEGLFIKRTHLYPRMVVNKANVFVTDSFYRINTKKDYDIRSLCFSFYNSLTFLLAELEGRFYGGGVLELTPNEFKCLSIPYKDNISEEEFNKLDQMLRDNMSISEILRYTNSILLENVDFEKLENIRLKLLNRRLKVSEKANMSSDLFELQPNHDYGNNTFPAAAG